MGCGVGEQGITILLVIQSQSGSLEWPTNRNITPTSQIGPASIFDIPATAPNRRSAMTQFITTTTPKMPITDLVLAAVELEEANLCTCPLVAGHHHWTACHGKWLHFPLVCGCSHWESCYPAFHAKRSWGRGYPAADIDRIYHLLSENRRRLWMVRCHPSSCQTIIEGLEDEHLRLYREGARLMEEKIDSRPLKRKRRRRHDHPTPSTTPSYSESN